MKDINSLPTFSNTAITIGKFDGCHLGHRSLINDITKHKDKNSLMVALSSGKPMILSENEREKLVEKLGVDNLVVLKLNKELATLSPEEFIDKILIEKFGVKHIAVGDDFRFGFKREGDTKLLIEQGKKKGFTVAVFPKVKYNKIDVSSTYIRKLIEEGNMELVNKLLGTEYYIGGKIVHGRGVGHRELYPTINIIPSADKILPPNGVYASKVIIGSKIYQGVTNIGIKPTFNEKEISAETYLLNCNSNLYNLKGKVILLKYLRPEKKFYTVEDLKNQITKDIENARAYFSDKDI